MTPEASPEASLRFPDLYDPIQPEVQKLEEFLEVEFAREEPFIVQLLRHVRRFRGKRIRPALLLMVSKLAGEGVGPDQIKIAAVIELIHTATLVHDDVLDDAAIRRKVETLHQRWGERVAVLMGDFIYSRAFALSTEVPGMAQVLSRATNVICEGELLQIRHRFQPDFREEIYLEIIRKKTAILYAISCELGARLGGLDAADCDRLHHFGLDLGMAFQIIDDCMDYAGDETVVGKSLGTDLRQGKATLPLILYLRSLGADTQARLVQTLSQRLSPDCEREIADAVRRQGALRAAYERAASYVQFARGALEGLPLALREALERVSDYVLRRRQ